MDGEEGDLNNARASTEEVSEIFVGLFFLGGRGSLLLLGLFLLLLLFFVGLGCGGGGRGSSARADFFLSVGDEFVEGFSLEGVDASVEVIVRDLRSDVAEKRLDVSCLCVNVFLLISFLPERASSA